MGNRVSFLPFSVTVRPDQIAMVKSHAKHDSANSTSASTRRIFDEWRQFKAAEHAYPEAMAELLRGVQ